MRKQLTVAEQWLYDTLPNSADVEHVPSEILESIGLVRMDWQRVFRAVDVYVGFISDNGLENDTHRLTVDQIVSYVLQNVEPEDFPRLVSLV